MSGKNSTVGNIADDPIVSDSFFETLPTGRLRDTIEGRRYMREEMGVRTSSQSLTKFKRGEFVAWDGEGITLPYKDHAYVLLANSLGEYIETDDCSTLESARIFDFILRVGRENPNAIHVVFSATYDFNMMLKSLSWRHLEKLYDKGKVRWGNYALDILMGKRLRISSLETGQSVTLWDVFPFFQCSFVKALGDWEIDVEDLDNIILQKNNRSAFSVDEMDEIRRYCFQELAALVALMEKFRECLVDAGIALKRWDGPGAIAANLYGRHRTKSHKCEPPAHVNTAAQFAYSGGRIELIRIGNYDGPVYYYDVRSAYPSKIARLPSLRNARWELVTDDPAPTPAPMSLYHIQFQIESDERFYPIPYRTPNGNIHYPRSCITWVWTPEYELLYDFFPGQFRVLESFQFTAPLEYPFGWVEEMFHLRSEWKREGRPSERILKLGLNSLYGKMIQQVGYNAIRGIPPYHQLEWGGYVTSGTRATLYRAARGSDAVVGFETDGILTTEPLELSLGSALGDWESESYTGVTYVQNGLYWLRDDAGEWKAKYRGFDKNSLSRKMVLDGWDAGIPSISASLTRFRGLGFSLAADTRRSNWGNWITEDRDLQIASCGSKRFAECHAVVGCRVCSQFGKKVSWANGLHDTHTYAEVGFEHSTAYPLIWKDGVPEWRDVRLTALDDDWHNPVRDV
jgi:hypothetical protein